MRNENAQFNAIYLSPVEIEKLEVILAKFSFDLSLDFCIRVFFKHNILFI